MTPPFLFSQGTVSTCLRFAVATQVAWSSRHPTGMQDPGRQEGTLTQPTGSALRPQPAPGGQGCQPSAGDCAGCTGLAVRRQQPVQVQRPDLASDDTFRPIGQP